MRAILSGGKHHGRELEVEQPFANIFVRESDDEPGTNYELVVEERAGRPAMYRLAHGQSNPSPEAARVLTQDIHNAVFNRLAGTNENAEDELCAELGITVDDIYKIMLAMGYSKCTECNCWWETLDEDQRCSFCIDGIDEE